MTAPSRRTWLVYLATNTINGKVYVGQTERRLSTRWAAHMCGSRQPGRKAHFQAALAKYGEAAFTVEVIARAHTQAEANQSEKHWIAHFNSANVKYGYNMTLGGDGGIPTEEVRQRLAHATGTRWKNPEYRDRLRRILKVSLSKPETRAKLSASAMGIVPSGESRKKMSKSAQSRCADPDWQQRNLEMRAQPEFKAKLTVALARRKADGSLYTDLKKAISRRWVAPNARAKQSAATIAQMANPAARKRLSEAMTGRIKSAETLAKMSAAGTAQAAEPGRRAEMSSTTKRLWYDPVYRAKQMKSRAKRWANVTPEWKALHREATAVGMKRWKEITTNSRFGGPDPMHGPAVMERFTSRVPNHPAEGAGLVQIGDGGDENNQ